MQRKFAFVLINQAICLLFFAPTTLFCATPVRAKSQKSKQEMVIVIDPGHGGPSLGARGIFAVEKDIVLKVAKKLGLLIVHAHPDVELVYTRTTDTIIPLEDRGALANKVGADLFISIHANSNPKKTPFGTETYVMGLDKTDKNMDVAIYENAEIVYEDSYETKYEGYNPNSPESVILFSFMQNVHMEQSLTFASYVEAEFADHAMRKSRGVKQGPFLVLWKTTMPSVLVEIGFISNLEEEKYIASERGQNEIAEAILNALSRYKAQWEKARNANGEAPSAATPGSTDGYAGGSKNMPTALPSSKGQQHRATYHVQIFSTSKRLKANAPEFKGLKNVSCYQVGSSYRYYTGSASSVNELMPLLKETRKKFRDAFIVKLRNGKPER
ncbi:MAG: N-acetylmuramoyl-L-alanine amidase [Prevotellaceae bacterium]|jgi:N-acetylmuramoyl-L-alanine amidase|nr:N-acetylmuramoyl-L-alanine amidase [Prevotellaceae bacterium]